jgi:hypothetical protein
MEAATAFWHSTAMFTQQPHAVISRGRDRQFESVENAVRFVMEKLDPRDRATAMIQTDSRSIHLADIEAIYTGLTCVPFFSVMGWNQRTVDFDIWLGNATRTAAAEMGDRVRLGELVGYEPTEKHPTGWAYRANQNSPPA